MGGEEVMAFDIDAKCGACKCEGHWHLVCPHLDEFLADTREWQQLAPIDLCFPKWELVVGALMLNGVAASVGSVLASAGPAGCSSMYAVHV